MQSDNVPSSSIMPDDLATAKRPHSAIEHYNEDDEVKSTLDVVRRYSDDGTVHQPNKRQTKSTRRRTPTPRPDISSSSDVPCHESWRERKQRSKLKQGEGSTQQKAKQPANEKQRLLNSPQPNYETIPGRSVDEEANSNATQRRFFSVVLFLFLLALGITLVISSYIKSDSEGHDITPKVVKSYAIVLIIVFLVWIISDKIQNSRLHTDDTTDEESGVLIPSHLLNGLVLFGVGSSVCQVLIILDFVKCQRYVANLDYTYLVYPFFEMTFMFAQIYVFYSLSKDRERKILFGNAFTMFTLAVNLTIWAIYFFAGAVSSKELQKQHWLVHYYYGIPNNDTCSLTNGPNSRKLHDFRNNMMPFMYTLAMEYSLLASALLLHLWLGITRQNAGEYNAVKTTWYIWRWGFIMGLLSLPFLGTMAANASAGTNDLKIFTVYVGEAVLLFLLLVLAAYGLYLVKKDAFRDRDEPIKVDIILLCLSWSGFLIFDLFTMFAASAKVLKTFDLRTFFLGIISFLELITTGVLTAFLTTSYSRKLHNALSEDQLRSTKSLRQIGSFCAIVSFGFWAMRTYTFRSKYTFDFVSENYYGQFPWFVVAQLSVPFCTFFHFHSSVCFTELIAGCTSH